MANPGNQPVNRSFNIHQRRYGRGFSQGLLATMLFVALAAGGVTWVYMGMVTQQQWPVRWLEIDGAFERVSAEQIRASLTPVTEGSFFTVDLERIKAAAYRQAWVADATVQKTWPDTVKVTIREFTPMAHWTGGKLVSGSGESFQVPGAAEIQGLPWLEGPDSQLDAVFDTWQQFNNELQPTGLEIELIRLDARGSWFLELNNGTEVQVGREDALERLQRLVKSWPGLTSGREMTPLVVDLRYTNGFAVRWPKIPARFAGTYGKEN
jgi:cell division protein FtsQ